MRKYTTPDMQVAKFDERDTVLTASDVNPYETMSTWGSKIDEVDFSVFE